MEIVIEIITLLTLTTLRSQMEKYNNLFFLHIFKNQSYYSVFQVTA